MSFDMNYTRDGDPVKEVLPEVSENEPIVQAKSDALIQEEETQDIVPNSQTSTVPPVQKNTTYETNLRALREKTLLMEKERNEAILRLQELESKKTQLQDPYQETDESVSFSEDELVEGKHLNKAVKSLQAQIKAQKEQMRQQQQQAVELAAEAKLKAQYADFDTIVNEDNLKLLRITHPEIAATIHSSNGDLYSKSVAAYTMIKQLGIHQEDLYKEDKETIQKNAAKPRPLVSVSPQQGDSPLSRANAFANGLTDDLKKQLYKEMMQYRHN